MPIIKTKCTNSSCNTSVISNTDKWGTAKKIVTIICPKCKQSIEQHLNPNFIKKDETEIIEVNKKFNDSINENEFIGWLIDNNSKKYYGIKLKIQTVGRTTSNKQSDILIDTDDLTLSGEHCIIEAKKHTSGSIVFTIKDNNSKNGIIINSGKKLEIDEIVYLDDGDSLGLGNSNFLFISYNKVRNDNELREWIQNNLI